MEITFTGRAAFDPNTTCVSFQAMVDGKSVACRISHEALEDHFDARGQNDSMIAAYKANAAGINRIAESKLRRGEEPFIRTADL